MQWLNPGGAWAFLALVPVLALYMLKKKAKRQKVPSLLLWRKIANQSDANRPFQKLKSKLLLWLQLLLVALLALALMRPASPGGLRGETALIFDLSASMQTVTNGRSRLDEAKEAAYRVLDEMRDGDAATVLLAGSALSQPLSRSTDRGAARRIIAGLQAENGGADVAGAVALAQAMGRELDGFSIVVLSDGYASPPRDVQVLSVGQSMPNRGIRSLRLSEQEDGMAVFCQVENIGEKVEAELECYADGALCDVRTVTLAKDGFTTVRFAAPADANVVTARFAQADALAADDAFFAVKPAATQRRALLCTKDNVFLEKALALDESLTVVKASPADGEGATGCDLYLFDGFLPETLPADGAVWMIAPDREALGVAPGETKDGGGALRAQAGETAQALTENLLLSGVAVKSYRPLTGGEGILSLNGDAAVCVTEAEGRRVAAIGFDLHDSNLPLKADFPVLMQNLLAYLLPKPLARTEQGSCGESVTLALDGRAVSARVTAPSGRRIALSGGTLTDTNEIGVYTLLEEREDGSARETAFALHMPAEEGKTDRVAASVSVDAAGAGRAGVGREWTGFAALLALCVLMLEWEVSRRGA